MELPTVFQNIWLADDDQDDCEIFRDVINQILPGVTLRILPNGEELMNMLTTAVKPDILFLDINMPRKDGLDCLLEIRAQRHFSRLPIIIFSSSKEPQVYRCFLRLWRQSLLFKTYVFPGINRRPQPAFQNELERSVHHHQQSLH
jgi:CheY-like chemotaxis protein